MRRAIILFLFAAGISLGAHAQTPSIGPGTLNATGGNDLVGTMELEWSIGEMTLVQTFQDAADTAINLTQGVLQPKMWPVKVNTVSSISGLNVFPNPATAVVNLQYQSGVEGVLTYRLMDMIGQQLKTGNLNLVQGSNSTQVDVRALACATYLLEVTIQSNNATSVTTYKIDKLK